MEGVYSTTKSNNTGSGSNTYSSCTFANIVCDSTIGDAAKLLLQDLGLLMYGSTNELFSSHINYFDNTQAERLFCSGGSWIISAYGLASFYGTLTRSDTATSIGFRSAFVKLPTA